MVKQGGTSYNTNAPGKKGIQNQGGSCNYCGRRYKQKYTLERHERLCKEYHDSR